MERGKERRGKKKKASVWFSMKQSLQCKSEASDVHDPNSRKQLASIQTRKSGRSGCSRSISNLKDVIHGSKRHMERPTSNSPRSIGSSEFLNPIVHEVILNNSTCELKITGFSAGEGSGGAGGGGSGGGSPFMGTLRPGTPGPKGNPSMHYFNSSNKPSSHRKSPNLTLDKQASGVSTVHSNNKHRVSLEMDANGSSSNVACHKCGQQFSKWESLETHHLSKHAVTELMEGDSSRKIVEIICRTSWLKSENQCGKIERVFKIHNMQKTIARFEEYRETVKNKASKLPKKHPRCIADGNELLRFHGTTVSCSLGLHDSSSLCVSDKCFVCKIIRHGFLDGEHGIGVFTSSTSARAFENIVISEDDPSMRKALIVCRVIAGRVHRPLENIQEMMGQTGFDSLAGKVGLCSNIEELYLLNPRALLPCFVIKKLRDMAISCTTHVFALSQWMLHQENVGIADIFNVD
ncbi:hypothetical protein V2J09_024216 [Rumex salicifolius]